MIHKTPLLASLHSFSLPGLVSSIAIISAALLLGTGCSGGDTDDEGKASLSPDVWAFELGNYSVDKPGSTLCNPCNSSLSCDGTDDNKPACVDYGVTGSFCGNECLQNSDCPKGDDGVEYECKDAKTVEGQANKFCVVKQQSGDKGNYGVCHCSDWAAYKSLSTTCAVDSKGPDGTAGVCPGSRSCTQAGLTACVVNVAPQIEVCDQIDNDCDGKLNEDTCDDKNPCTSDVCVPWKGCVYEPIAATCHDGDVCTEDDKCVGGQCKGTAKKCDDGNICTTDSCDSAKGCKSVPADGVACDDGKPCTIKDTCLGGSCTKSEPKKCDDGNPCTEDLCHVKTGDCIFSKEPLPCDDGDKCTENDKCDDGSCKAGTAVSCDDQDTCTKDTCEPSTGCVYLPVAGTGCTTT